VAPAICESRNAAPAILQPADAIIGISAACVCRAMHERRAVEALLLPVTGNLEKRS